MWVWFAKEKSSGCLGQKDIPTLLVPCQTLSHLPANCVAYSDVVDKTEGRNFQHIGGAIFSTKLPFLRRSLPVEDVPCPIVFLLSSSGLYKIFIATIWMEWWSPHLIQLGMAWDADADGDAITPQVGLLTCSADMQKRDCEKLLDSTTISLDAL